MSVKTFVDTNILIYAHDLDAKEKHLAAKAVLDDLWANRTGVISTQVLQEFYVNVTRKLKKPLAKKIARTIVDTYMIWCVDITTAEIAAAFRIEDEAPLRFLGALLFGAGIQSGGT